MSVESILEVLRERGLEVRLRHDGQTYIHGPKEEATPALLEALKAYKDELKAKLTPEPPPQPEPQAIIEPAPEVQPAKPTPAERRTVLLADDGSVERILEGVDHRAEFGSLRNAAAQYPGRRIAAEWRKVWPDGTEEWIRFAVCGYPGAGEEMVELRRYTLVNKDTGNAANPGPTERPEGVPEVSQTQFAFGGGPG